MDISSTQLVEFVQNHPLLIAAFVVVLLLLIGNEAVYALRGGKSLGPVQAVRMINDDEAVILDVRGENEYRKSHILNARHIPRDKLDAEPKQLTKLKDHSLIVCATTDTIAGQVRDKLSEKGYAAVYSLKGGLGAWQGASLPVTKK